MAVCARGPRVRLDAEFVRDNALAVAGLLNDKIGGPSVKPYQPPGIWDGVDAKYEQDKGGEHEQSKGTKQGDQEHSKK